MNRATSEENNRGVFVFLIVPIGFVLLLLTEKYGRTFMHRINTASSTVLWLFSTLVVSVIVLISLLWWKIASTKTTVILAVIAWTILLWMLFYLGFWDFGELTSDN